MYFSSIGLKLQTVYTDNLLTDMATTTYGLAPKIWRLAAKLAGRDHYSLRQALGCRFFQPTVVAIGGNSFSGQEAATAANIIRLHLSHRLIITHGNGPQVGEKLEQAEAVKTKKSIAQCIAETQLEMGETLKQHLDIEGSRAGLPSYYFRLKIIPTRIIVDLNDIAFNNPSKFIGREFPLDYFEPQSVRRTDGFYDWIEGGETWVMKELPKKTGIFRRVVPSPKPLQIYPADLAAILEAHQRGYTVVAAGGGGVPVLADGTPVEAVIDKDLASALLCREVEAAELIISTGIRYVAHNYRQPDQMDIAYYWAKHALANLLTGQYPAGQMGEKIEAAINALRFGVNQVLITEPGARWDLNEGTVITRGADLTGRFYNLAVRLGLRPNELRRWLIA